MLYCQPEFIQAQPKASFAGHVRGQTKSAVPFRFSLGYMEKLPRMEKVEKTVPWQRMRDLYDVHHLELGKVDDIVAVADDESKDTPEQAAEARPPPLPPGHVDTDAGEAW